MHDYVPELVRESEALAICGLVPVEENAGRRPWRVQRHTVYRYSFKVAMDDKATRSLHELDKIFERAIWDQPSPPYKFRDSLGVSFVLVYIELR